MRGRRIVTFLVASAVVLGLAPGAVASGDPPSPATSTTAASSTTTTTAATTTTTGTTTTTTTTAAPSDGEGLSSIAAPIAVGGAENVARAGDGPLPVAGVTPPVRAPQPRQVGPTLPPIPPDQVLPENSGSGRRIVYANGRQRVWVVEADGTVVRTMRVSGKQGIPSPGTYSVWSKSRSTFAAHNPTITWEYMTRFAWTPRGGNVGFHAIPYQFGRRVQTEAQLGQFLSGGCVRMRDADAIFIYNWAGIGTKVVVLP